MERKETYLTQLREKKEKSNATYLMHPDLFAQLSFVRGFNKMNGERYQAHILMIFEDRLSAEDKIVIMATRTPEDALEALTKMGINFTHNMEEN